MSVRGSTGSSTTAASAALTNAHPYVSLLHMHPGIRCIDTKGRVEFTDGEILDNVDHILLCTGYTYHFPFLTETTCDYHGEESTGDKFDLSGGACVSSGETSPVLLSAPKRVYGQVGVDSSCLLTVTDRSVRPLYQHLLCSCNPTLAFLGLPLTIVPFPLFYLQARYLGTMYATATTTTGELADANICSGFHTGTGQEISSLPSFPSLPSLVEREAWIDEHESRVSDEKKLSRSSGSDDNMYHNLGPRMWEYLQFLQQNSESNPFVDEQYLAKVREIYEAVVASRPKAIGYPDLYRDDNYTFDR